MQLQSQGRMRTLQHLERFVVYSIASASIPLSPQAASRALGFVEFPCGPLTNSYTLHGTSTFCLFSRVPRNSLLTYPSFTGICGQPSPQPTSPFSLCPPEAHLLNLLPITDIQRLTKTYTGKLSRPVSYVARPSYSQLKDSKEDSQ